MGARARGEREATRRRRRFERVGGASTGKSLDFERGGEEGKVAGVDAFRCHMAPGLTLVKPRDATELTLHFCWCKNVGSLEHKSSIS